MASDRIRELERAMEEGYEESVMCALEQEYLKAGETDKARKLSRKIRRLYPSSAFSPQTSSVKDEHSAAVQNKVDDEKKTVAEAAPKPLKKQGKEKEKRVLTENIKSCFQDTIGLKPLQVEVEKFYNLLLFQVNRASQGFNADIVKNMNFIICANEGSGKSHVSEIIAKMLFDFGIRKNERPLVFDFPDVVNAFSGANQPSKAFEKLFSQADDTTVVLDNLERLNEERNLDWMYFFATLNSEIAARSDKTSFIVTGREDRIAWMMSQDSTIAEHFRTRLEIKGYSPMELYEIMQKLALKQGFLIREDTRKLLVRKIDEDYRTPGFQNTRTLQQYLNDAVSRIADRFYTTGNASEKGKADLAELTPEDFGLEDDGENLETLLAQLDALVGLKGVKEQVKKRVNAVEVDKKAQAAGAERKGGQGTMHLIFTGNAGTGKTTVARILGSIYRELGILPRGDKIVECSRGNLVGKYQGHSAANVQEKFRAAAGGVLFIDEAYSLCKSKTDSFGRETVDELVAQIENYKDNTMVILAGYSKDMHEFMKANQGLESRFRNRIEFEDYTVDEMAKIFNFYVSGAGMKLSAGAEAALKQMIEVKSKVPGFGNARGVRNLFDDVREAQNGRVSDLLETEKTPGKEVFDTIEQEDIEMVAGQKMECEKTVEDLLEELNRLTGLASAKKKVQEMVDALYVKKEMESRGIVSNEGFGTLHQVFYGNAGTGKTTVARIIGDIYAKLGVLQKNTFVEVGRSDLVASHVGQTAIKVVDKVEEADGGILFIDEAYQLQNGDGDSFGLEAINTLVAELENRRESLMVIIAGYERETDSLLEANQGLGSRFPRENRIHFEDYSVDELTDIFLQRLNNQKYLLDGDYREEIKKLIVDAMQKEANFGNARGVRNLIDDCIRRKNSRIAAMLRNNETVSDKEMRTLRRSDITGED